MFIEILVAENIFQLPMLHIQKNAARIYSLD